LKRYVITGAAWLTGAFNKAREKLAAEPGQDQQEHELNQACDKLATVTPSETGDAIPTPPTAQPEEVKKPNEVSVEVPVVEESKEKPTESEPPKKSERAQGLVL
jgi:hypothetical protein